MTSYEFLLLLHIITVIVWLGAAFTMDLLFLRAERTGNPADLGKTAEFQEWLVPRLFIPFGVLTLVFGVLLVFDGPWSFGDLWILIGLVGWIAAWGVGFLFLRPHVEKMKKIVMEHGPTSPEAHRQARLLAVVSRVQLLSLFLVVAAMVLKPTSDDPWTLVVLAAILVAAAAVGAWTMRKPLREAAPVAESQ
ncbi:MAG: DUF2269 domain-containing protein [Actinomycetota bacterium]|nr:DUF2269 domain-containing protein [Actinomycetota bacterium]